MNKEKEEIIEYLMCKFSEWHKEETGKEDDNFHTLKFTTLMYLTIISDINKHSENSLLDDVFTELWAEPYGVVDREVKAYLRASDKLEEGVIKRVNPDAVCNDERVLKSLEKIKKINSKLITYSSWDLMRIVQKTYAWIFYMNKARKKDEYSSLIPKEIIKNEERFYFKTGII